MVHELTNVDLAHGLDDELAAELRRLLDEHRVLVVRDQHLTMEQQVAVAQVFGGVRLDSTDATGYVSNVQPGGVVPEGRLLFHSDYAFTAHPVPIITLHAVDIPADGCPTLFADGVAAARRIPAELRSVIEGREALHIYGFAPMRNDVRNREADLGATTAVTPRHRHPVLFPHPRTGDEVLYVGEMQTDRIEGLDPAESERVLHELFALLYDPANVHRHVWRDGDVVVWDNIAVQHAREYTPAEEARTLQRVAVADHTLFELVPGLEEAMAAR